jgi:hypothetical protein
MGYAKQMMMEQQEQAEFEEMAEWIREQLDDPDANQDTPGWHRLVGEYDLIVSGISPDLYDDEWDVVGKSRIDIFNESITSTKEILTLPVSVSSRKILLVMLHAHLVTAVEAYLSSSFIEKSLSSDLYMRKIVESDPEFAKRQFTVKELFSKRDSLKDDLRQYLKDIIFHDLARVKKMYAAAFEIDFGEVTWLFKAISFRHDCVHRAGYDKDGKEAPFTTSSIQALVENSEALVFRIEKEIIALKSDNDSVRTFKF